MSINERGGGKHGDDDAPDSSRMPISTRFAPLNRPSQPPSSHRPGPGSAPPSTLSSMQKAIFALDKVKAKLDALERQKTEPIAILGMACRFPGGGSTPEAFFRFLLEGGDAVAQIPEERWQADLSEEADADPVRRATRWGAFLRNPVDQFDARFFGISPREAAHLDPQHRLLLELAWEALERAGQDAASLVGTPTGVFVGTSTNDYIELCRAGERGADVYAATGNGPAFASGRLSYVLGLQGPSVSVDTACSSSLVAVHLACQSLRSGEATLAIAAGVNLMLSPTMTELVSTTKALAPDGRCRTFDAGAGGFVRGEGSGVVVLKLLSEAQHDGDPILATIRGSAVNQDGRSTGLTTPNVLSQQAMLRHAHSSARISADDVGYVEAHGTGTSLGDPIEIEALKAVIGRHPRADRSRCVLGAVKTNIGHLEAAAGIAGLIKAVMALQMELIPRNAHFRALNPRISLEGTPFVIPTETLPWRRGDKPRLAGVSSFGLSGTNAHVILEEAPGDRLDDVPAPEASSYLVPVSARSPGALRALARAYAEALSNEGDARLHDVAYTASVRRTHHEHRLAVAGRTHAEVASALVAASGDLASASAPRTTSERRPKVVFVFPGQGSQWVGMARQLLREERAFREAIEVYEEPIQRLGGFSVQEQLAADASHSRLGEIHVVQPVLFAVEVALANLWRSWGVEPDAVIGHSMGEVAAARISGVLTLDDAAKVICRRSRLLRKVSGKGAMALVELSLPVATEAVSGYEDRLGVAVSNAPRSTVLSGDPEALDEVLATLEKAGIFCRRVKVDVASHSPQMDPLREDLLTALRNVQPRPSRLPMRSTVTGETVRGPELDAAYWVKNLREPVLFGTATQRLADEGFSVFIEMSPHPILLQAVEENLREKGKDGVALPSMRRDTDERRTLLGSLGALYARGYPVEWKRLFPQGGHVVKLPTYAWERERHWVEGSTPVAGRPLERTAARPLESTPGDGERARDGWLWELAWRRRDRSAPRGTLPEPWLVLSDRGGTGEALVQWLRERGATAVHAVVGASLEHVAPGLWEIDPADPNAYRSLLRDAFPAGAPVGVVSLLGLVAPPAEETTAEALALHQRLGSESALLLSQAILRAGLPEVPRLWLVTRGAVATGGEAGLSIAQAPLWGLGRSLQAEHPELGCTLVDLAPGHLDDEIDALGAELGEGRDEDQIALRSGGRFVGRLARSLLRLGEGPRFGADASYLVTGGLGGLGLAVAAWMVERGARHVALTGRRPPSEAARDAIARMEAAGAKILVATADVSRKTDVDALVARIRAEKPKLRGVVHAAGVLMDRTVLDLTVEAMRAVAAPKIGGGWNLHAATRDEALDFFVLYASGASLLGPPGQANYAAANAFLDALAHDRRARGLPALAIDWGPFSEVGLAAADAGRGERLAAMGFRSMTPGEGNAVLGALLGGPAVQVGVMPMDVALARASMPRLSSAPYFQEMAREGENARGAGAPAERASLDILRQAAPSARQALVEQMLREDLARILRLEPSQIERTEPFYAHGFDSLMALELRNRLQVSLGLKLTVADIVGNSRIDTLAEVLTSRLDLAGPAVSAPAPAPKESTPGGWVVIPRPAPGARMRLFCFPYAGGAAHIFSSWPAGLPAEIEVCAIQPPGRHERLHEPLPSSVEEMVAALVPALLPYLDRPFAMFGHCLGAIVMFEVIRELAAKHDVKPAHVFASGAPAPGRYLVPSVATRSPEEFLDLLRFIGFARAGVLDDPDVARYLLPAVRADFDAAARYEHVPSAPLDVPLTTFAGKEDPFAPPDAVEEWRLQTSSWYAKVVFPGEHYFIVPEREGLLEVMGQALLSRLASVEQRQRAESATASWLRSTAPRAAPRARLFCFPGVGHGSSLYEGWADRLGDEIEVLAVQLPGRGPRAHELPLGRIDEIVDSLLPALRRHLDLPYAMCGLDAGAIVMFEVTRRLRRAGSPLPRHLCVAAAMAPQVYYFPPMHHLPRERLLRGFRDLGTTVDEGAERPLRAECAAMASYAYVDEAPLDIPVTAFMGEQDGFVPPGGVRAWARQTGAGFTLRAVPGDHDFVRRDPSAVLAVIGEHLLR